jgi:hypothetical protein
VTAAALAFVVVSGVMNALFLSSLGRTNSELALLAVVSVAADIAKAALPVLILWLWSRKAWAQLSVAVLMLVVLIIVSLASGTGYAAAMRGVAIAKHEAKAEHTERLKSDLVAIERQLEASAPARPVTVIDAEQRVLQLDRLWSATKACTDVTQPASRTFCASVRRLDVERASSEERQRLSDRRDRLREQLGAAAVLDETADASLQVAAIAELLGFDASRVRQGFSVGTAVVLEFGCVLLLLVVGGTIWTPAPAPPERPPEPEPPAPLEAPPEAVLTETKANNDHLYWQWLQRINSGSSNESRSDGEQGRRGRGVRASGTRAGEAVPYRAPARRTDA